MAVLDTNLLIFLLGLFIILSPGLILTLPGLGASEIYHMGIAYDGDEDGNADEYCAQSPSGPVETGPSGAQCVIAQRIVTSKYTSMVAILVHAVVFGLLVMLLPQTVGLGKLSNKQIFSYALAFVLLSPGFLLTLPALTADECGMGSDGHGRHIADASGAVLEYCDAPDHVAGPLCKKCESVWNSNQTSAVAVVVHSILFAVICYAAY